LSFCAEPISLGFAPTPVGRFAQIRQFRAQNLTACCLWTGFANPG
jgi:hypothetical protein